MANDELGGLVSGKQDNAYRRASPDRGQSPSFLTTINCESQNSHLPSLVEVGSSFSSIATKRPIRMALKMEIESPEEMSLVAMGEAASRQFALLSGHLDINSQRWFIDQQQRYESWASSLGLYHLGHSSLDYRFRDSPPLFEYASSLLEDLNRSLLMLTEIFAIEPSAEENAYADGSDNEPISDGESDEDFSSYEAAALDQEYITSISLTIDRLYALSFRIRNPKMRMGLSRALGYSEKDPDTGVDLIDAYRIEDLRHIIELFTVWKGDVDLDCFLVKRLALANTHRRQQFKYWAKRKAKYDDYHQRAVAGHGRRIALIRLRGSEVNNGRIRPSEPSTATYLDPEKLKQTDSVGSNDSFVVTSDDANEIIAIPPPPVIDPTSSEAECPYCFIMCSQATFEHRAWRRHIMRDLRPYICTFEHCHEAYQQYDTMTEWMSHEVVNHKMNPGAPRVCPFCSLGNVNTNHVARHLRRAAAYSLPRDRYDTEPVGSQVGSTRSDNITSGSDRISDMSASDHGWNTNKKSITFILDGDVELVVDASPADESLETLVTPPIKEHWPSSELPKNPRFEFLDLNGNPVPLDYDSVFHDMRIYVKCEGRRQCYHKLVILLNFRLKEHLILGIVFMIKDTLSPARLIRLLPHGFEITLTPSRFSQFFGMKTTAVPPTLMAIMSKLGHYTEADTTKLSTPRFAEWSCLERLSFTHGACGFGPCLEPIYINETPSSITTYGGRGVAKPGVNAATHAAVYMSNNQPSIGSSEYAMLKEPLEVEPQRMDESLDPKSRLNFVPSPYYLEHAFASRLEGQLAMAKLATA
ncbi:hypothetical protein BJX64DRAFT_289830 [Aspergillus heterothallicus]